jgi:hypothetical protein
LIVCIGGFRGATWTPDLKTHGSVTMKGLPRAAIRRVERRLR